MEEKKLIQFQNIVKDFEHHLFQILVEANICGRGQRRLRFTHMMFLIMFSPDFMEIGRASCRERV